MTDLRRRASGIVAMGALFAGCGGTQPPIAAPGVVLQSRGPGSPFSARENAHPFGASFTAGHVYRRLSIFNVKDGAGPLELTAFDGILYGTTSGGGRYNAGTFFSLTTSGERHTLRDFSGENGEVSHLSVLTRLSGLLYGWTSTLCNNPSSTCGAMFSLNASGRERIVHVFREAQQSPTSLTTLNGVLYGTTANGKDSNDGTVFSLTPSGDFHVLYRFKGAITPSKDGAWPVSIVALNGRLYGATEYGGTNGNGTVFSVTTKGKEHVIYSFGSALSGDGALPNGVTALHGKLYGTTFFGGKYYGCFGDPPVGCGTAFSVTTVGKEQVLYSFKEGRDGNPATDLASLNGKLYGTTSGTLFSITTAGTEKTLHSFYSCGCSVLTPLRGTLYGTTVGGGKYHSGTAYAFTP
ncbi:MAG: choice-of-anchor tandem repeat GloVer-containing protein [Candidatus Cybelea sp.]